MKAIKQKRNVYDVMAGEIVLGEVIKKNARIVRKEVVYTEAYAKTINDANSAEYCVINKEATAKLNKSS